MPFPSLVGGFTLKQDFAPSIIFAVLYGLLTSVFIYRLYQKQSRTTITLGTACFVLERIVFFCLRATVARQPAEDQKDGLIEYMQSTLALGFLTIIQDLANILRCVLVNSTYPSDSSAPQSLSSSNHRLPELISDSTSTTQNFWMSRQNSRMDEKQNEFASSSVSFSKPGIGTTSELKDQPRLRFWFRRLHDAGFALFLVALTTGTISNSRLINQRADEQKSRENQTLRYVSSSGGLLLAVCVLGLTVWAGRNLRRVNQRAISYLTCLTLLLVIPGAYRLSVMYRTTSGFESTDRGSYNAPESKAAFYILHILPEWLASCVLAFLNVRQLFGTGFSGDNRWRDETKGEREKRQRAGRGKSSVEGGIAA